MSASDVRRRCGCTTVLLLLAALTATDAFAQIYHVKELNTEQPATCSGVPRRTSIRS